MEAIYMNKKPIVAGVGDVVMTPGNVRGIVIVVDGIQVRVLAIATKKETGETFVLTPRFIHEYPASECYYMENQMLNP